MMYFYLSKNITDVSLSFLQMAYHIFTIANWHLTTKLIAWKCQNTESWNILGKNYTISYLSEICVFLLSIFSLLASYLYRNIPYLTGSNSHSSFWYIHTAMQYYISIQQIHDISPMKRHFQTYPSRWSRGLILPFWNQLLRHLPFFFFFILSLVNCKNGRIKKIKKGKQLITIREKILKKKITTKNTTKNWTICVCKTKAGSNVSCWFFMKHIEKNKRDDTYVAHALLLDFYNVFLSKKPSIFSQ